MRYSTNSVISSAVPPTAGTMFGLTLGNRERDLQGAHHSYSPAPSFRSGAQVLLCWPMWKAHTGPEAYTRPKVLRIAGDHEIKDVWEDNLASKARAILE